MPWPDRTYEEWKNEILEDLSIIMRNLFQLDTSEDKSVTLAIMLKEARRLESDIYRIGVESLGIERETINSHRL